MMIFIVVEEGGFKIRIGRQPEARVSKRS